MTDLALSVGQLTPTFDPSITNYSASVGFLSTRIRVTPDVADAGLTIQINGTAAISGQQSQPIDLFPTVNSVTVSVDNGAGQSRTYTVAVTRAPLSGLSQDGPLLKAAVANADDVLGWSIAIDGNTMAVGAPGEAGASQGTAGDPSMQSTATQDSGAVYVFRRADVGSPWLIEAYIKAANNLPNPPGAGDFFGFSVALSGNTLAVGAPNEDSAETGANGSGLDDSAVDSGAVYIFTRTGTSWSQQAYLKASNTDPGDSFGFSLALQGDTLIVGAPFEDNTDGSQNNGAGGLTTEAGAAYAFTRTGDAWAQQAYLKAGGTQPAAPFDAFGQVCVLSGETAVVSAPGQDSIVMDSGAAYVFQRAGVDWLQQDIVRASNADLQDFFGAVMAIDGDMLVVGTKDEDSAATGVGGNEGDNSAPQSGAVYVFARDGATWMQEAYLKASNTRAGAAFGSAVALRGGLLAVGSQLEDGDFAGTTSAGNLSVQGTGSTIAGAAYLFTRSGGAWAATAYVKATPSAVNGLGSSLALDDASLVVGAILESTSASGSGAAYVFR